MGRISRIFLTELPLQEAFSWPFAG